MRIDRVELYQITMPLIAPFETSGWVKTHEERILVALYSDGVVGWGEFPGDGPWYSYETPEVSWIIIEQYLIPMLLGRPVAATTMQYPPLEHPRDVRTRFAPVRGYPFAKHAVESAVWDLWAKQQGISLSQALGGTRDRVQVGVSVGIQPSIPALVDRVGAYLADGYARIKIKIKPGYDLGAVEALRAVYPHILLQVDANSAYHLDDAPIFVAMDGYDLLLIEQPLEYDDIPDHAKLQAQLKTPICLDESIHTTANARWALEGGSCRIINIKPARLGGFTESIDVHDLCAQHNAPVWCGGMLETGIGRAGNVALASLPNFRLPGDISASRRYYAEDIVKPEFVLNSDSTLSVPQGPGIGVEVCMDRILARMSRTTSIDNSGSF
ncbi:MAG: o-succinylbenzoate synthase [Anaerolineae bacterium]